MNEQTARLLDRLDQVRDKGRDRWVARCPAHEDRKPSLSIAETPDGRVLVNCFSGCAVEDVLAAVGLTLEDLFPPRESVLAATTDGRPSKGPSTRPWTAAQVLDCLDEDMIIITIAVADRLRIGRCTPEDLERVTAARRRLNNALALLRR